MVVARGGGTPTKKPWLCTLSLYQKEQATGSYHTGHTGWSIFKMFYMYGCLASIYVCTMRIHGVLRGQKRVLDVLELGLQIVGSLRAGSGN